MDTHNTAQSTLDLLTLDQVGAMLGCTTKTLYDLRAKGRGPRGFRVGPRLLFRRTEIESWLARLEEADGRAHRGRGRR
jgi:predicted DNA-binding transcriptional regulator AlpA